MANYANLLATIAANIKAGNGVNATTGYDVETALDSMVTSLGAGYQFMGVATPSTTPSNTDIKQFYLASEPGTYTNFLDSGSDPLVVNDGEVAVLKYDTAWSKEVINEWSSGFYVRKAAGVNLLDKSASGVLIGKYISSTGSITNDATYNASDYIPVEEGVRYRVAKDATHGMRFCCCYDADRNVVPGGLSTEARSFVIPAGCVYVRVTLYASDWPLAQLSAEDVYYEPFNPIGGYLSGAIEHLDKKVDKLSVNLLDPSAPGVALGKYLNYSGTMATDANYNVSDFLAVEEGVTYYCAKESSSKIRFICSFDRNKVLIDSAITGTNVRSFTVPSGVAFVRVTLYASEWSFAQIAAENIRYVPYNPISGYLDTIVKNHLSGKKWVACGDSFTEGDFTGSSGYLFEGGRFSGEKIVYPFIIALRDNMDVVNEAKSGSTMAYVDGQRYEFSTPGGRYTQIPADADYITLYFGINDVHQDVPIGTISDTINTTFYGAWNIVMDYLITNHPNAKIGIIITNGPDNSTEATKFKQYTDAERAIAKKYGIPYLDYAADDKLPYVLRQWERTAVASSIKQLRDAQFRVGGTNWHPNVAAHNYQSTFIEQWLLSL